MLERMDLSSSLRYSNPVETFNWSPVLSKNLAVYIYIHINCNYCAYMNYSIHPFCSHVIEMLYIGALKSNRNL